MPTPPAAPPVTPPVPFTVTMADFLIDLTTVEPSDPEYGIKPIPYNYCATLAAAQRLQEHLATIGLHPTLSMNWPQSLNPESPVIQSAQVPWLTFTNGSTGLTDPENAAGILIEYMIWGARDVDWICVNQWYQGDL
jgi:hypothetical protein